MDAPGLSQAQRVHLPTDRRGGDPVCGDLHHDGAGAGALAPPRAGPRHYAALAVFLADRAALILLGQRADLSDVRLAGTGIRTRGADFGSSGASLAGD